MLNVVDKVTAEFVKTGYQEIVSHWLVSGLFASVFSLYVIYFLYKVKYEDIPYSDASKHLLKAVFVFSLALSWDFFYILVYRLTTDYPMQISEIVVSALKNSVGGSGGSSLGHLYDTGMDLSFEVLRSMSFSPKSIVTAFVGFVLMFLSTLIFTIIALGLIVISKFILAICLVLAPYFISMYLFNGTKGLSESWLKYTLGSALTPLFVGIVLALILILADLSLINIHGGSTLGASNKAPSFSGVVTFFCTSLISLGLLFKTTEMAASLTSSLTQMSMGSVGRRAAQGASGTKGAYQGAKSKTSNAAGRVKGSYQKRQQQTMSDVRNRSSERNRLESIKRASMKKRGG